MRFRCLAALPLALLLSGCSEVDGARFGFFLCFLFALPLVFLQVIVTSLGHVRKSGWHAVAMFTSGILTSLGALVVVAGCALIADLQPANRAQLLGELVGLIVGELLMVGMTVRLAEAEPAAGSETQEPPRSVLPWVLGGYVVLATGAVTALMIA